MLDTLTFAQLKKACETVDIDFGELSDDEKAEELMSEAKSGDACL